MHIISATILLVYSLCLRAGGKVVPLYVKRKRTFTLIMRHSNSDKKNKRSSTTGKPTHSFATERVSLDSVRGAAVERTLSQLLPGANIVVNALRLRTKAFICGAGSEKMDSVVKT